LYEPKSHLHQAQRELLAQGGKLGDIDYVLIGYRRSSGVVSATFLA
jgi:hypothetical protein